MSRFSFSESSLFVRVFNLYYMVNRIKVSKGDIYWYMSILVEVTPMIYTNWDKARRFKCRCKCWKIKICKLVRLRRWSKKNSCWCMYLDHWKKTHWLSTTKFYRVYTNMIRRCYDEKNPWYKNYWAKGVSVSNRWLKWFENFKEDMYSSYLLNKWKRICLDKDKWSIRLGIYPHIYSKKTCEWLSQKENMAYSSITNTVKKHITYNKRIIKDNVYRILNTKNKRYFFRWAFFTVTEFSKNVSITIEWIRLSLLRGDSLDKIYIKHWLN